MSEHDDYEEDVRCAMIDAAIEELGDEVIEAIRADEREMIIEFIRQDEWLYKSIAACTLCSTQQLQRVTLMQRVVDGCLKEI